MKAAVLTASLLAEQHHWWMIQEGESAAATEGAAPIHSLSQNHVLLPPKEELQQGKTRTGEARRNPK